MKPEVEQIPMPALPNAGEMVGAPPVFGEKPVGKKPKSSSGVASFLGGASLPAKADIGTKTLTGQ